MNRSLSLSKKFVTYSSVNMSLSLHTIKEYITDSLGLSLPYRLNLRQNLYKNE